MDHSGVRDLRVASNLPCAAPLSKDVSDHGGMCAGDPDDRFAIPYRLNLPCNLSGLMLRAPPFWWACCANIDEMERRRRQASDIPQKQVTKITIESAN